MESKVLLIDREKFLDWYFDNDTAEGFFHTFDVLESLKSNGTFTVDAQSMLDDCGYIPEWVVDESQTDVKLIDDNEVDTSYYDEIKFA